MEKNIGEPIGLSLSNAPASLIQAVYHAATGKTENLSKRLTNNVVIRKHDLDELNARMKQQLEHYKLVADPSFTTKIIYHTGGSDTESQQYTSWGRFGAAESSRSDITSEVVLRYEFLIRLPAKEDLTQRYIVTIDVDSKLPIIAAKESPGPFSLLLIRDMPTVTVSIDFIDYLCAKNFLNVIETWFKNLEEVRTPRWMELCSHPRISWPFIFSRVGYLGAAAFIFVFIWQHDGNIYSLGELGYLGAMVVAFTAISNCATTFLGVLFAERIGAAFMPSSILITAGDERAFRRVSEESKKAMPKIITSVAGVAGTLIINVVASYLYSWVG